MNKIVGLELRMLLRGGQLFQPYFILIICCVRYPGIPHVGICGSPELCASTSLRLWGVKLYCGVKNY